MATNPVNLQIPANSQGVANCVANAAYFQRVTLTWDGNTAVFSGSGEGVAMTLPSGETTLQFTPDSAARTVSATFEYSSSGSGGPFSAAAVRDPVVTNKGGFNVIEVTSEDSTDNDNNDSYLTIATVAR